ncbi:SdpI family protein [Sharpea azabuensis]
MMKYFFMIIDYSIPLFMIFSYPWWKKIANGDISQYSGMRTTRSMENKENWKKAQLLCGKYCVRVGIVLLVLVVLLRFLKLLAMEWNSVLIASINILALLAITYVVNKQI